MTSRKTTLASLAVASAVGLFGAAPALAGQGGNPTPASCGLGKPGAQEAVADSTSPGATENARISPQEFGCTGK